MKFTAVINHIARKAAGVLFALLALVCAVGCNAVFEYKDVPLSIDANLRLLFAVPGATKADTYDYADPANQEGMDNAINPRDLEIYFFTEDGEFITSVTDPTKLEVSPYSSGDYNPHYHMYSADMRVDDVVNGQRCRVVVVAHRRSWQRSFLPFCVPVDPQNSWLAGEGSTDEERLYNSLYFNFSNSGAIGPCDYARYNCTKQSDATVPMWGFSTMNLKLATIDAHGYHNPVDPSGQIDMLRSIAKVKININPEFGDLVTVTDFNSKTKLGGVRLVSSMTSGFMTPAYNKVRGLDETPVILNKDREGGVATGAYTNEWIRSGLNNTGQDTVYPFYKGSDGSYYIYLPEHRIGQAWMQVEFKWSDPSFVPPVTHDYKLLFADYEAAMKDAGTRDVAFTEEELKNYRFPVMRNHYYEYTISSLNPIFVKFEVCEWQYKSTDIYFN